MGLTIRADLMQGSHNSCALVINNQLISRRPHGSLTYVRPIILDVEALEEQIRYEKQRRKLALDQQVHPKQARLFN